MAKSKKKNKRKRKYVNPFRPGAGHTPPHLAGRKKEQEEFVKLLDQEVIMENLVLTGLRGVGKTVLLDKLKPVAMQNNWLWVGDDLSETTSLTEQNIAIRMITDLSAVTSTITLDRQQAKAIGFAKPREVDRKLNFDAMSAIHSGTPGLSSDKIKAVLEIAWKVIEPTGVNGVVFAYDEAQNMTDHAAKNEYPLSLMLDVFQSIQKKGIPFMLLFTGLPTLFPKLVEARTFAERMFHVLFLDRLNDDESREAIVKPVANLPTKMSEDSVDLVIQESGGYPYFLQFMCREVYDVFLIKIEEDVTVSIGDLKRKLDTDFFAGRWAKASDRQRELLEVVSLLPNCDTEFTIQEVCDLAKKEIEKPFSNSQINQMFSKLSDCGLVYKNRHGKYSFAVPLLGEFIQRQMA